MTTLLGAVVAAGLSACSGGSSGRSATPAGPAVAPGFELPMVDGAGTVSLAAYRGRPVLLNFWASSCAPCRAELPDLQAVHRRHRDVAVVGVDEQDVLGDARRLLADTGVTYPSAYDREGALAGSYRLFGLPSTVLVGRDGRVLDRVTGPLRGDRLERLLRRAA